MHKGKLKFASLFSGCGGFDLGFIAAGFEPQGAYDFDAEAVENYAMNIDGPVKQVDLTTETPSDRQILEIDVLIAGPPCQGFSTAGKRLVDDARNHLLTLTGELARSISPKVLIVENVSGALAGEHALYWQSLDDSMRLAGYHTNILLCQAAELGMAQLRRRVLFFAWRTGTDIQFVTPKVPAADLRSVLVGASNQRNHRADWLRPQSRDWLIARRIKPGQKLSNVRGGPNAVPSWEIPEVFGYVTQYERTVLELLRRLRRQNRQRDYGDADPVSFARLEAALGVPFQRIVESLIEKGYLRLVAEGIDLVGTFNGKFRRLAWDRPSSTVDTRFGSPRYFLHPSKQRGFTVREAARIQGFADSYVFRGTERGQYRLIGNAVPPPLGAFAAEFAKRLLGRAS